MHPGKKLSEHIYQFNKLIDNLVNIDVDIDDEYQALMLLMSLPPSYDNFMETLLYGRESITLEDVLSSLNSRELKKRTDAKDDGDGLYVRGRSDHQDCQKRNKKKSTGFVRKNGGQGSGMHSKGYDNGDLLMADFNGGTVLLGDNRACAIMGIGKISLGTLDREGYIVKLQNGRVKVIKGSLMVLSRTMKGNCMYSLDGWAESGEASVGIQEKKSLAQVWHKRLGHISEAGLHELEKREVLRNKGLGKLEFYENCVLGKSTRVSFGRGQHATEGLIDYVHADLLGLRVEPISGCRSNGDDNISDQLVSIYSIGEEDTYGFMVRTSGELRDVEDIWDVVFNESLMYGVCVVDSGKEVEFEVELQGNRNLDNYVLVRDRAKRITTILIRYRDEGNVSLSRPLGSKVDDMTAYAFAIVEEEDTHKPITFQEAINSSEKDEPDIAYAVSIVSGYLANPGLVYGRDQGKHVDVDGFVNADYAKDPEKEAEYMALTEAVKERIWLKGLLNELGVNLREIVESKEIKVAKIGTKDNAADAFTKVVPGPKFKYCMEILGVGIN
nr:retrovirus-related Pol polyprotein from transposon TNT 1-94 [Tanacetum cinerariifolium]